MTLQVFTAGQTLTAGQMNTLQQSTYSYQLSTVSSSTYTIASSDVGKMIIFTNTADPIEVTVPENLAISNGDCIEIVFAGTGSLQLIPDGVVVLNSEGGLLVLENQYSRVSIVKTATNEFIVSWLTSITTAEIENGAVTSAKLDSNLSLSGTTSISAASISGTTSISQIIEKAQTDSSTVLSTTATNIDILSGTVYRFTNAGHINNFKLNIRGNGSTTLSSLMTQNLQSITVCISVISGSPAVSFGSSSYFTIGSSTVSIKWFGGVKPTGNLNSEDFYTFTIFKTGADAFTVLASQAKFA